MGRIWRLEGSMGGRVLVLFIFGFGDGRGALLLCGVRMKLCRESG